MGLYTLNNVVAYLFNSNSLILLFSLICNNHYEYQGCTLTAPGRLRQPTFVLWQLKKITGRPAGHPALLFAIQRCGRGSD